MADQNERPVPPQPSAAPADDGCPSAAAPAALPAAGVADVSGSVREPVVVTVETRRMGRGLTAFIVVAVSFALLCFAGCTCVFMAGMSGTYALVANYMAPVDASYYESYGSGPQIGVFHMDEAIDATSGISPELVRSVVAEVDADPAIVALVVRCDCPGGGAAASEEISATIASCQKPVVFSVGSMCASGAYFAASQADWIVANKTSEVGAIGTYMAIYELEGLYDKLGIEVEAITSSASKDMGAEYRSLTDEERAMLQEEVDALTALFVESVATGRGVALEEAQAWADGTTVIGTVALERGMVDELGTYDTALARAAALAGYAYDDCQVVSLDATSSDLESLASLLGV